MLNSKEIRNLSISVARVQANPVSLTKVTYTHVIRPIKCCKNVRVLIRLICHINQTFSSHTYSHLLHVGALVHLRSVLGDKDTKINHILRLHEQSLRSYPNHTSDSFQVSSPSLNIKGTWVRLRNHGAPVQQKHTIYHILRNMMNMVVTMLVGRLL